jgi:sugar phosphate permease
MRVRPFFWFLLALSCISVLIFAANVQTYAPALLQVHIQQQPKANGFTTIELHLTDPDGLPIDQAQIASSAWMTNMNMVTNEKHMQEVGQGNYIVQLHLYMVGPWEIKLMAQAPGFVPKHQTLLVEVV